MMEQSIILGHKRLYIPGSVAIASGMDVASMAFSLKSIEHKTVETLKDWM